MYRTTSAFYFSEFDGNILTEENAETELFNAALDVFQFCLGREPRTDFQKDLVARAICRQAELQVNQNKIPDGMTSFSIDGMSYSFDSTRTETIDKDVKKYLLPTGLLNRCL